MDSFIVNNNGDDQSVIAFHHQRSMSEVIVTTANVSGEPLVQANSPAPAGSVIHMKFSSTLPLQTGTTDPQITTTECVNQDTMLMQQNIHQDSILLADNLNQGQVLLSQGNLHQVSVRVPQYIVNQESVAQTQHNVNQRMLALNQNSDQMPRSTADIYKEEDEVTNERISDIIITSNSQKRKPGVILLGRGNSFSLGRSEVMLLHANRQNAADTRIIDNHNYHSLPQDTHNIQNNNDMDIQSWNNRNLNQPDHVAPLFNRDPNSVTSSLPQTTDSRFVPVELETLWQKAELIMAAKETVVQQVLEEFGIGDAGSSGEQSLEKRMEETIWQAVQDSFQM